jgi:hypothetical protein
MRFEDLGFPRCYDCEILMGLPGTGPAPHEFRRPGQSTHSEGLVLKVTPHRGESWVGNFQRGDEGICGAYGYPEPTLVCAVARGQGYLVATDDPSRYELVEAYPIRGVQRVPDLPIIVFADYTALTAYGPKGRLWATSRLSWDGLRITEITPEVIRGVGWDAPHDREVEFLVDVKTGGYEGGSSPEGDLDS